MSNPNQPLIDVLNVAQAFELAGILQYLQHSLLMTGPLKADHQKLFHGLSEEAHEHAALVGDKIVSLGGLPTVEPRVVCQANTLEGMLALDIDLEVQALATYQKARAVADSLGLIPYVHWLDEHIAEERGHVEELKHLKRDLDSALAANSTNADDGSATSAG